MRSPGIIRLLTAAVTFAAAAVAVAAAAPFLSRAAPDPGARFDGEYGLWVGERDGMMQVRWLTREPAAGRLEVLADGVPVHETATEARLTHAAEFPRPRAERVVLRYGALNHADDREETVIFAEPRRRESPSFRNVDSLYVIGDIHGEFDRAVALLQNAGVLDGERRWSAGGAHLVFLGDLFSRGDDVTRLVWFIYGLEHEAREAGGRVHVVLGNHEIMTMLDDLRYVSAKELALAGHHGIPYSRLFDPRHSVIGRWLATKPALLQVNDILLAHGGVTDDYLPYTLRMFDDSLARFMREDLFYHWADTTIAVPLTRGAVQRRIDFFWGANSVFWFRGYVLQDDLDRMLRNVLRRFRSSVHVVAHTPTHGVHERYDGRLIAVHPPQPALEMLLMVRQRRGYDRFRIGLRGPPIPF